MLFRSETQPYSGTTHLNDPYSIRREVQRFRIGRYVRSRTLVARRCERGASSTRQISDSVIWGTFFETFWAGDNRCVGHLGASTAFGALKAGIPSRRRSLFGSMMYQGLRFDTRSQKCGKILPLFGGRTPVSCTKPSPREEERTYVSRSEVPVQPHRWRRPDQPRLVAEPTAAGTAAPASGRSCPPRCWTRAGALRRSPG